MAVGALPLVLGFLLVLGTTTAAFTPGHGPITSVPGFDRQLPSKHYGGYITVDEDAGRHLYYYMAMSERDPGSDPVLLWLNGGPGCSSFDGFLFELGPFNYRFTDGTFSRVKLTANPYAWNKAATVIFLDSPAGVGLSYSENPADYSTNDTATARDTEVFLRKFFQRHPDLQELDFYISGESYAGIYVPNAAHAVVEGNRAGHEPHINLKGYLVGNGCTDAEYDGNALPPFAVGKSLISAHMYSKLDKACDSAYWKAHDGGECGKRLDTLREELAPLNVYNILEECHHGPRPPPPSTLAPAREAAAAVAASRRRLLRSSSSSPANQAEPAAAAGAAGGRPAAVSLHQQHERVAARYAEVVRSVSTWPVTGKLPPAGTVVQNWAQLFQGVSHNPPCTDASEGDVWLNDPAVRRAIHAAPVEATGAPWTVCSDRISYTHDAGSMLWIHRELTQKRGLRALIYSGDEDMAVPHTGSEAWTHDMGLKKVSHWSPWFVGSPRQVAGYTVAYEGLTYATVKGAGHMVPQTKPAESLEMLKRFLAGEKL